jgi:pimeloyl-ACP methyl ester carboxylesterase
LYSGPANWHACPENPDLLCGFLKVPTDYTNASAGSTTLALTKYPAQCSPEERLGAVIINYGGPGASGRAMSFQFAPKLSKRFGGRHDVISFDMRGLGHTTPNKVNCFGSARTYEEFKAHTVLEESFSLGDFGMTAALSDRERELLRSHLLRQQQEATALIEAQARVCEKTMGGEALKHMSTTTLVRDMARISEVLEGPDALINFVCSLPSRSIYSRSPGSTVSSEARMEVWQAHT